MGVFEHVNDIFFDEPISSINYYGYFLIVSEIKIMPYISNIKILTWILMAMLMAILLIGLNTWLND